MKKSFKIMIALAAMLMLLGTASTVFASEDTPPEEPLQERGGAGRTAALADKLGLTEEELQAKLDSGMTIKEIAEEMGVELPTKGKGAREFDADAMAENLGITVEELQAYLDSGMTIQEIAAELGVEMPIKGEGHQGDVPKQGGQMSQEKMAEILGITVEELQAYVESGKTLQEIAEELGVELAGPGGQHNGEFPGNGENRPEGVQGERANGERPERDGEGGPVGGPRDGQTSED